MINSLQGRSLIIGDFNLPGIDWDLLHKDSPGERVFLDTIQDKFYTQHVDFATQDSGNILDLVLSSSSDLVHSIQDFGKLGCSDHRLLKVSLNVLSADCRSKEMVPDWAKADLESMRVAISYINWEETLSNLSGISAWDTFKSILECEIDRCIPKKPRRTGQKPLWLSKDILRLIRRKRRLWRWYSREGGKDYESFMKYKSAQKEVATAVRKARRDFERPLAKNRKANSKAFFSHIKKNT